MKGLYVYTQSTGMAETVTIVKDSCLQLSYVKCLGGEPHVLCAEQPNCPQATAVQETANASKPTVVQTVEL